MGKGSVLRTDENFEKSSQRIRPRAHDSDPEL